MRQGNGLALLLGALFVTVGLLLWPVHAVGEGEETSEGQAAFMANGCNMCHSVAAAEIVAKTKSDKMKGPDVGGKIDVELAELAAYLRKEVDRDGDSHNKEFKGTDEELQAIVDWLGSLEATE